MSSSPPPPPLPPSNGTPSGGEYGAGSTSGAGPSRVASSLGKNSSVGCIVAGCAVALLGFIALIVAAVLWLLPSLKARLEQVTDPGPALEAPVKEATTVTSAPAEYFTFSFEPSERPPLALGSNETIEDEAWPEKMGDFTYDDGAYIDNPLYSSQIGGATYFQEDGGLQFYVIVVPYEGLAGFKDLVNSSVEMEFPDGEPALEFLSGLPIFYEGEEASTKFTMLALRDQAAYITMETTDESALANDQLIATALVIFDALTGQTSPESTTMQEPAPNLVPAPLIAATFGYDEGNDRELKLSAGPSLANGVAWPELEATEVNFALARAGVDLPETLTDLKGEAAGYSALNFELDASRPVTTSFFPVGDGRTLEQVFARVLSALANQDGTISYEGYEGFYVTDENDEKIAEVAVQTLSTSAGLVSLAAFENGVLAILPETAPAEEPAGAFPPERELALNLTKQFSINWSNAAKGD